MQLRHLVAAVFCIALVLAAPLRAAAQWHRTDCLPGQCGSSLRAVLVTMGVAAASAFVAYKIVGRDKPDGLRPVNKQLEFERGAAQSEIAFVNASDTPVRVLSIALRQGTAFQLAPGVSMPVELAPQQPLRVDVLFSPEAPGKYQDEVVVSTRGFAAEKLRLVKVKVRGATSAPIPVPALAEASR